MVELLTVIYKVTEGESVELGVYVNQMLRAKESSINVSACQTL
jgi:hypothetical protein